MVDRLLVRFKETDLSTEQTFVEWIRLDAQGRSTDKSTITVLEEFSQIASRKEVIVVYPGDDLLLRSVSIPQSRGIKLDQVIPYALEDEIAEDISQMHIVHSQSSKLENIPIAIVNKDKIKKFAKRFIDSNITPKCIIPEPLILPWKEGALSIFKNGNSVSLRYSFLEGCTVNAALTETLIRKILSESHFSHIRKAFVWGDEDGAITSLLTSRDINLVEDRSPSRTSLPVNLLEIAQLQKNVPNLNLLKGPVFERHTDKKWLPGKFAIAAGLLIFALTLLLGSQSYRFMQLKEQNNNLQVQIHRSFKQAFPDTKRIVDPLIQAKQNLEKAKKNSGGDDDFMALLFAFGNEIRKYEDIELTKILYHKALMDVMINTNSIMNVEKLNHNLAVNNQYETEIVSTKQDKNNVNARIKIRRMP